MRDDPGLYSYVLEEDGCLKLYFDPRGVQSVMWRDDPNALALDYTRTMMASLLLQPAPRDVLVVGLGGGSLSKFCYRHLPEARITSLEIDAGILARRRQFCIPPDDARFRVIHADAAEYLQGEEDIADILLLDGYDADGLPPALTSESFYRLCRQALRPGGVLAANLWHDSAQLGPCLRRLGAGFGREVKRVLADDGDNDVAFALRDGDWPGAACLAARCEEWQARVGLDFSVAARVLAA